MNELTRLKNELRSIDLSCHLRTQQIVDFLLKLTTALEWFANSLSDPVLAVLDEDIRNAITIKSP